MSSPVAVTLPSSSVTPVNPPANGATLGGLNHWLKDTQNYEAILAEMEKASADTKFKDELVMVEQWFKVLSESERTASVYTLLQCSTQEQIRFFMAVLQKMVKPEEPNITTNANTIKPRNSKVGLRPLGLNIPSPSSPSTQTPITTPRDLDSASVPLGDNKRLNLPRATSRLTPMSPLTSQDGALRTPAHDKSWASLVNTPLVPMFQKPNATRSDIPGSGVINDSGNTPAGNIGSTSQGPGLAAINSTTLEKLAKSGLSNDAQLLAIQLVMSGILQPTDIASTASKQDQAPLPQSTGKKKNGHGSWRTTSTRHPGSALRGTVPKSAGSKSSGSKSSGLKSSGLDSASMKIEDINHDLLRDIPAWLRSLRLHKYTACFEGMTWQEMVVLDDAALEEKGVAALGARRRLLRTFNHACLEMGVEGASSTTPTPSAVPTSPSTDPASLVIPQSVAPTPRLSADCPIFLPASKVLHGPASASAA